MYIKEYSKFLLAGDFNTQDHDETMVNFLSQHNSRNLVKEKTCFKSIENPTCIDLLITNNPHSFQNTLALNVGNSDFHKMVLTV